MFQRTLTLRELPRTWSNTRWALHRIKRFLWWAINRLPQHDPPPMIVQGGDNFLPPVRFTEDGIDEQFDGLINRLMEDLIKLR